MENNCLGVIDKFLLQLHWQFKDRTEMCEQKEFIKNKDVNAEIKKWAREVQTDHPIPDSAIWMMCEEQSEYFVKTAKYDIS